MGSDALLWSAAQEERHLLRTFAQEDREHAERVSQRTPSKHLSAHPLRSLGFLSAPLQSGTLPRGALEELSQGVR